MDTGRIILEKKQFELTTSRLCHQLAERHDDFSNTCIVGIQPRGAIFSDYLVSQIRDKMKINNLDYGKIDITFHRDDYRLNPSPKASKTEMDFKTVENKKVVLIDDVLYTGRTVQAALNALQDFGRPKSVELMVLVDRRFNRHLPIQPNYTGIAVDALDEAYVKVAWNENPENICCIYLFPEK